MTLHMDVYGMPKFRLRLAWLFGLVSKEIKEGKKKPEERRRMSEGKPDLIESGRRAKAIFKILRTRGLLSQLIRLLRDIFSQVRIRKLETNLRLGLDNPADTGLLFALIGPAIPFLCLSLPYRIRVEPSFDKAAFEGYLDGSVRLWPIRLVRAFMRFFFSLATVRVIKTLVLTKWGTKRRKSLIRWLAHGQFQPR